VGGRMDTLQCAIVLAKLERFDAEINARIEAGERYRKLLEGVPLISQLRVKSDRTCVWGQFTVQVENREIVQERLKQKGIPIAIHYPIPLHQQPAYAAIYRAAGSLEKTESVSLKVLSLPMHPYITEDIQRQIVGAVVEAVL
jgi:UDP-2-acetamido-2-deoxy-ribo-hexuluronate aminotransferase